MKVKVFGRFSKALALPNLGLMPKLNIGAGHGQARLNAIELELLC